MNLSIMTINFNFVQEDKVKNLVLNVFFYRDKLPQKFSDLGCSDQKLHLFSKRLLTIVHEGSWLTVVNNGFFKKTIVFFKKR